MNIRFRNESITIVRLQVIISVIELANTVLKIIYFQ